LDILKISEERGVVNKVGGGARQAGLNGKLKSVVDVSIMFYGFERKLTRIRTFARFLDAANFTDGNLLADATQHLPIDANCCNIHVERFYLF
jgi:lambda family phage minor tail protein L